MSDDGDRFIVHRLRATPVEYSVTLRHFVSGGVHMLGVTVHDVMVGPEERRRVASDLRAAADMLEEGEG